MTDTIHLDQTEALAVDRPPYEFNAVQSEIMARLGRAMRDVGIFLSGIGILSIIGGITRLFIRVGTWEQALVLALGGLLPGGILLLIGFWTRAAGGHFQRVATTAGADVQHLMEALDELRHAYGLLRTVIAAALILMVFMVTLALFASPVSSHW
jgi:hypothetical protein